MRVQQIIWNDRSGWTAAEGEAGEAALVLYFGSREALAGGVRYAELRGMFAAAHVLGCSTGGQINNNDVNDDEIVAAAVSEISPHAKSGLCELHNQTMTVTTLAELV